MEARKEEDENNGEGKRKIATKKSGGQERGFTKCSETMKHFPELVSKYSERGR